MLTPEEEARERELVRIRLEEERKVDWERNGWVAWIVGPVLAMAFLGVLLGVFFG